jgi:hypothetical protein
MAATVWIFFAMWLSPESTLPPAGSMTAVETQAYYSEAACESAKKEAAAKRASIAVCLPSSVK